MARRLLGEPLLQFLALGAVLFGLYAGVNETSGEPREIVIDQARIESLVAQFERSWQRAPAPEEREALVATWLHEEILYREGLALGLDRDDAVVRRRIVQKMDFLADVAAPTQPSDAELEAWLAAHPSDYRIEAVYSLRQLYFDPGRRGDRVDADLAAARAALARGASADGDPSLLPAALEAAPASEVARIFGTEFAAALDALALGGWQGPVRSGYGVHLVELRDRQPARAATLADARTALERDWRRSRREAASRAFYEELRRRYAIRLEDRPLAGEAQASGR